MEFLEPPSKLCDNFARHRTSTTPLTFSFPRLDSPPSPSSLDLLAFLASCTSLKSLQLYWTSISAIAKIIAAVRAPLALLHTHLDHNLTQADDNDIAGLVAILELPAAARLKRFRIPLVSACLDEKRTRAAWEDACRAR